MVKRVVLVGATDGIGLALAHEYARRGWWVGLVGRNREKLDRVTSELGEAVPGARLETALADVSDPAANEEAFDEILVRLGQMDLMIYCAGVMPSAGSLEERLAAAGRMLDVNLRGAIDWLERSAEYLSGVGRGRVAAIGSVAGVRGRKGAPVYGATKAGLHEYMEGLRHRLHGTGVGVTTVKPGWVRTRMLSAAAAESVLTVSAERAARIVADRIEAGSEVFFVPARWGLVASILRLLPRFLYKRVAPP